MDQDDIEAIALFQEIIRSQNAPIKYYFYYDPSTGNIVHFRNYLEVDDYPYIEVKQTEVDSDISISEYQVVDIEGKKKLIKRDKSIDHLTKIDDTIHQISKKIADLNIKVSQANYQFDLLIEQDNIKKEFRIHLSGAMKDQYHLNSKSNQHIFCYVTAENDPNILYKTLDIPLRNLLQSHYYTISYGDYDGTLCNIFSMRYFQNYLHLVIE